jgi:hypothetical protein
MRNYIILDGKKYKCPWKAWQPEPVVPSSARLILDGSGHVVFGPTDLKIWTGELEAPVTPEDATWGDPDDLRTSLRKRNTLSFTDHFDVTYTVKAQGPFKERSLSPVWDGESNVIFISMSLMSVTIVA